MESNRSVILVRDECSFANGGRLAGLAGVPHGRHGLGAGGRRGPEELQQRPGQIHHIDLRRRFHVPRHALGEGDRLAGLPRHRSSPQRAHRRPTGVELRLGEGRARFRIRLRGRAWRVGGLLGVRGLGVGRARRSVGGGEEWDRRIGPLRQATIIHVRRARSERLVEGN